MLPRIEWSEAARADVRRLDKTTAMRIFDAPLRFARTGLGDIKALKGEHSAKFRLRIGDYRRFFSQTGEVLLVHAVKHRRFACR